MVSERLKLNDWSGPRVSERLALLLACCACVFTLYIYTRTGLPVEQLLGAAAALLAYMVTALVILAPRWVVARRQPLALSIAMLAFAALAAWLVAPGAMSVLMLIPALHAALLLSGKPVRAMLALAALSWFVLKYVGDAPQTNVLLSLAEILPAAIILVVVHALSRQLARTRNQLTALAYRDELTQLLNMRSFTRMLQAEHAKAEAGQSRYALLMVDILGLQSYNDRFGHEQGNRVIVAVADALKRSTGQGDLIARYGGDEFILFLPAADDAHVAEVSNKIAQNVYNITLSFDRSMHRVVVNIGAAQYPDSGSDIPGMLSFADRAMYREKEFRSSTAAGPKPAKDLRQQAGVDDWS